MKLHLDRDEGCCLGVLAGIAEWLDIPVALVRIVFVICVLAWPPILLGYVIAWFLLDRQMTPDRIREHFSNSETAEHLRRIDYRKGLYRNERNKRIAGVCSGIADYLEVSAFSVRVVTLLSLFLFGPFTFWAYLLCWFVFPSDPQLPDEERSRRSARRRQRREARRERHARKRHARAAGSGLGADPDTEPRTGFAEGETERGSARVYSRSECTGQISELESRLREMEAFMTSKRFRLHCEINRI